MAVAFTQSGDVADAAVLGERTVTIPAGAASADFTVATVDDEADEADAGIVATLKAGSGYTVGDASRATVTVADDDEAHPGIVTKRGAAREGEDDAVVFTVRLGRQAAHTVTVDYATADGAGLWVGTPPATAGVDYTATSGTLTFAAGETWKSVSVPVLDDVIDEGSRRAVGGRGQRPGRRRDGPPSPMRSRGCRWTCGADAGGASGRRVLRARDVAIVRAGP